MFYTPYKEDSTIAEILYEWDVRNFEKGDNVKKSLSFNKAMIKKYNEVVNNISKIYGKSIQQGSLENLDLLDSEALKRSDKWKINDNFKIYSSITLSENYKEDGIVTTVPTHKIRLYITNEKK